MAVPPVKGSELSSEDLRPPSLDLVVSVPGRAFRGTVVLLMGVFGGWYFSSLPWPRFRVLMLPTFNRGLLRPHCWW